MDGLRAAAALAVVMIHVSAGQTTDAELVWNQLSRFAVPMFLVLTGFGHAGALAEGKFEPQGRTAVRRRLSRVLPAYFLWSAAYLVLEALCGTPHAHPLFDLLTGGAYLHIAHGTPDMFAQRAESAMALFASTSPSYLILQSLDAMNPLLATSFPAQLKACAERLDTLKAKLRAHGYALCGEERTKLCLLPKSFGYTGTALAEILTHHNIYCEFSDADHLVMMFTPEITPADFSRLEHALLSVLPAPAILSKPPVPPHAERVLSPREALFSPSETLPLSECENRILADANVSCPPAVPLAVCGERLTPEVISAMEYYGTEHCTVIVE